MRRSWSPAVALLLTFVPPLAAENGHDHREAGEEHPEGPPIVHLSQDELEEFGIEIETAGPGIIESRLQLPGEVRPNADRVAHIVPRYNGIVVEVHADIGDRVERGQVLAVIEGDESLAPFEVKTLISGTVIGKHITLGEAVSRDTDTFVIAGLSTVWVDLTLYQRDLGRVKPGLEARVYMGHDAARDSGRIAYVAPVVDERTRTATARMVLANDGGRWLPGMFVTVDVRVERTPVAVAVPRAAVHTLADSVVVFVETGEGFAPRAVTPGRGNETHVEIVSGLSPGDRYVGRGGFTLKAELGKNSFGHGHGH